MPPEIQIAQPAEADLLAIADFTLERWGEEQAIRYIDALEECMHLLAVRQQMGRACDSIHKGLRRHEHGKHVVLYKRIENGIRVLRVMHQQSLPELWEVGW